MQESLFMPLLLETRQEPRCLLKSTAFPSITPGLKDTKVIVLLSLSTVLKYSQSGGLWGDYTKKGIT